MIDVDKEILNMEEAAEFFGVSIKTFIKLLKEEKVPARKIGREWRFSKKALVEWLASGDSQVYSSSDSDTRDFFDQVAPRWDELRKNYYDESIKNKLLELQILSKQMTVMDLGSGDGFLSRAIAGLVKKVIAVDISGVMLRELERKVQSDGIDNIHTLESDGRDMPIANAEIDVVCASMYLHHIDEPELAIKEMYRVLKPGGKVFLGDLHEHGNQELKEQMHDLWPGFKTADLKKWFKEAGFINIKVVTASGKKNAGGEKLIILTAEKRQ